MGMKCQNQSACQGQTGDAQCFATLCSLLEQMHLVSLFLMIFLKDLLIGHVQKFENSNQHEQMEYLQLAEMDSFFLGG